MSKIAYKLVAAGEEWLFRNVKCRAACPAHTDVPTYINLALNGKCEEAYLVNKRANLFPAVLGRVCTHQCEAACRRTEIDEPVAIRSLKRYVSDETLKQRRFRRMPPSSKQTGRRVAIIGAGPVGLTAAHDLVLLGHQVTIYESSRVAGGMLALGIPEYRLPRVVMELEIDYIRRLGVEIVTDTRIGESVGFDEIKAGSDAVIIAAGAHKGIRLGIPGEDLDGIYDCVDLLRDVNLGSWRKPGNKIVVIGGGNSAIDSARTALRLGAEEVWIDSTDAARTAMRLGASEVNILYRRTRQEMPADSGEIDEAEEEGVYMHYLTAPVEIIGKDGRVAGLRCVRMQLSEEADASGRRRPIPIEGSDFIIACDTVISAIGQAPDLSFLPEGHDIELTLWGSIDVDEDSMSTSERGIFAAGDAVTGPKSVIEGVAAGHKVARSANAFMSGLEERISPQRLETRSECVGSAELSDDFDLLSRTEPPTLPLDARAFSFEEVERGFDREEALRQARRCLRCDHNIMVDPARCILCGGCVDVCPNDCISLISADSIEGEAPELEDAEGRGTAFALILDEKLCVRCGTCVERCPVDAISMVKYEFLEV